MMAEGRDVQYRHRLSKESHMSPTIWVQGSFHKVTVPAVPYELPMGVSQVPYKHMGIPYSMLSTPAKSPRDSWDIEGLESPMGH